MRAIVQRVHNSSVSVDGNEISRIGQGLLCYIGINRDDIPEDAEYM